MRIKKNVAISQSGLLFNPSTGESFSVNPIGIEVVTLVNEGRPFEEICSRFLEKYSTDKSTFEKDFNDFESLLANYDLLDHEDEETA